MPLISPHQSGALANSIVMSWHYVVVGNSPNHYTNAALPRQMAVRLKYSHVITTSNRRQDHHRPPSSSALRTSPPLSTPLHFPHSTTPQLFQRNTYMHACRHTLLTRRDASGSDVPPSRGVAASQLEWPMVDGRWSIGRWPMAERRTPNRKSKDTMTLHSRRSSFCVRRSSPFVVQ